MTSLVHSIADERGEQRLHGAMLAVGAFAMLACGPPARDVATPDPLTIYELHPDEAPPPAKEEVYVQRPGTLWVGGHWNWEDGEWVWHAGYYEPIRAGYRWEPGHYGPKRTWVEGHWVSP
jgi:hypothetical protein